LDNICVGQDQASAHLASILPEAMHGFKQVIVLTHVPPFREAAWHKGSISNDDFLPFFSCKAVGDVLIKAALQNPEKSIMVLCGHTHSAGVVQIAPNLLVKTGDAEYGAPKLNELMLI
jgi:Icc-related predicted phosphoesterase